MATIDVTNVQNGAVRTGPAAAADWSPAGIPSKVIDQAVIHGRRLRSQAIAGLFTGLVRWGIATAKAAVGRRASTKLGCGECGDMMRA